jgi:FeS assembly protein IscX
MATGPNPQGLYWETTYEIVLELLRLYPDVNVDDLGTEQLFQWIVTLPNFADDPSLANEDILNEILREWYEEVNAL